MRHLIAILLALLVIGCAGTAASSGAKTYTDAERKAIMAGNLAEFADQYPGLGSDIAVNDGVLIVATNQPDKASAICSLALAASNDPITSKPIGIIGVIVVSGGEKVADC